MTPDGGRHDRGQQQGVLRRRLGTGDAVVVGLGAMLGAGVFAAFAPAARAAGSGVLLALLVAAAVAACNATSSARLAAVHPQAGGAYVYGRRQLGPVWGFIAGWAFVVGKAASCAAMALTAGAYAWPEHPRPVAAAVVVVMVAVNLLGITRTAGVTRVLVAVTLAALAIAVTASLAGGQVDPAGLSPVTGTGPYGVLQGAGLLFFAFAGYARIATLGEEVRDPARTIGRAVPTALALVVAVYAVVGVSLLLVLGPDRLADSTAPLQDAVRAGRFDALAPAIRFGAVAATLGVLLSLLAGVARTTLAMARDGELPRPLAAVHPRFGVPHRAELVLGLVVLGVVLVTDLRGAIGFSSAGVLTYYAIANASAFTLAGHARRWLRPLAGAGIAGCLLLTVTLPPASVATGVAVLAVGLAGRALRQRYSRPG